MEPLSYNRVCPEIPSPRCYSDWLGIRNVLLQHLEPAPCTEPAAGQVVSGVAGLVLGGGGAARAAVYALASLECVPIYLVGRDMSELEALVAHFPQIPCVPISDPADAVNVKIAVGCVPAIAPVTPEEVAADLCARSIFSSPCSGSGGNKRVFLDMCYKPRTTPLMLHARSEASWIVVSGIEAMLEQGFAQARMWLAKSVNPPDSMGTITPEIEDDVRTSIRGMPEIVSNEGSLPIPHNEDAEVEN
jgi:quinate dehydrogenase